MQDHNIGKYVAELSLQEPIAGFPKSKKAIAEEVAEGIEQSFLNAKSLVSFVSKVNGQKRKDVLNSVLIAQLVANKKFPNEDQILDWYKSFIEVLNNLGWAIEQAEFSEFETSGTIFEVENAIIDILTTAFGGTFITVIKKTLSAIKDLADSNGHITAFEKNTHSMQKGAFQIGLAMEENDTVALQLGTFLLTSDNQIKKILFFKSIKDSTKLNYCSRKGTLNEEIYAKGRDAIVTKLGDRVQEFIAEIDID
jgi:hypothetical protein